MSARSLVLAAVVCGSFASSGPAIAADDGGVAKRKAAAEAAVPAPRNKSLAAKHEAELPPAAATAATAASAGTAQVPADTWSPQEIAAAKARCAALLKTVGAVTVAEEPIRAGTCGTAAPVKLISIGRGQQVVFSPPPTLTCDMVAALGKWLSQDVQPLAKAHLGAPVVKIESMSSYSCRNAFGRVASRLSEHGRANALDIRGFAIATGEPASVLGGWGPTAREIRAQVAAAAKAAAEQKAAAEREAQPTQAAQPSSTAETRLVSFGMESRAAPEPPAPRDFAGQLRPGQFGLAPAARLGGPKQGDEQPSTEPARQAAPAETGAEEAQARRTRFLREAHAAACKHFGTVLGPESNAYHRNHFHVDMADRQSSHFCE